VKYGILHVWRENREDSPIHAIGVEIWEQNTKIALVAPVHCAGWLPSQVHEYLRQVLEVLGTEYGFKKLASQELSVDRKVFSDRVLSSNFSTY
jgi:hypothetical protein